mgnify:CR=1 FL=1
MKPLNPAIFLKAVLVMALFIAMPLRAEPDTKLWPIMKEAFFAKRDMQEADFIKIDAPRRAESGAQVPVSLESATDSPVRTGHTDTPS